MPKLLRKKFSILAYLFAFALAITLTTPLKLTLVPLQVSFWVGDVLVVRQQSGINLHRNKLVTVLGNPTIFAQETIQATLVRTIDTSQFSPPSPDTAGITYLAPTDRLLASDSEVNEMTIFAGVNLFEITLAGSLLNTASTTSFSNEPTGVAFNPDNEHLFFSDDDAREVFELNPGTDGLYGTADDIITSFDTIAFGSSDPEGIAFGQGDLFIVDGVNTDVYRITPGTNGSFDGVSPTGDDQVSQFDVASMGLADPEGIAFNSQTGTLFILGSNSLIAETTTAGSLIRKIDITEANADKPAGLTLAPGSLDPAITNLYITERGVDNNSDPNENDGRIYEMSLPTTSTPTPTPTPPLHCSPLGDIDCSGKVNGLDFASLVARWGTADPEANLDDIGTVDAQDALILLSNFGQ